MRNILFLALVLLPCCKEQQVVTSSEASPTNQQSRKIEIIQLMQGRWIHSQDTLATVEIQGTSWDFKYKGEADPLGKFQILISDTSRFVDKQIKADFLTLQRSSDTLQYEINGITANVMSLTFYPLGKIHVYDRSK